LGRHKNFQEVFGTSVGMWFVPVHSRDHLRRLLDISRLSGGGYPEMEGDGLDPSSRPSRAGDSPKGLSGRFA